MREFLHNPISAGRKSAGKGKNYCKMDNGCMMWYNTKDNQIRKECIP